MKKRLFLKTNVIVCTAVVIGFLLAVVLTYRASLMIDLLRVPEPYHQCEHRQQWTEEEKIECKKEQ